VSSAGDVNGDGVSDILIGAMFADGSNNSDSQVGEAYVLFGFPSTSATVSPAQDSQVIPFALLSLSHACFSSSPSFSLGLLMTQLALPAESLFGSTDELYGSCVIFASLLSELSPAHARTLDQYLLQKGWVYKGMAH